MSYTVTCPGCKTTFEVDEEEFDDIHATGDPIECPECEEFYNWDYDPDKPDGKEITLTDLAVFEDEEEEGEEMPEDIAEEEEEDDA